MNGIIAILCLASLSLAVAAGPYPYYKPYAPLKSYYYGGMAPIAPAAALAAAPAIAPAAVAPSTGFLSDYYTYAAATALGYPGYAYGYPYFGAYTYPYLKK